MFDRIYNFIGFIRNSWVYTTLVRNPRRLYPLPNVFKTIFDCFDMSPMQQTIALINRRPERTGSTESESHNDLTWLMSCYNRLPSFHFFSFHFDAFDVHVIHALSIHSACVCVPHHCQNGLRTRMKIIHKKNLGRPCVRCAACPNDDDVAFNGDNAIVYLSKLCACDFGCLCVCLQMNWVSLLSK